MEVTVEPPVDIVINIKMLESEASRLKIVLGSLSLLDLQQLLTEEQCSESISIYRTTEELYDMLSTTLENNRGEN